jgi:hypothetical protein
MLELINYHKHPLTMLGNLTYILCSSTPDYVFEYHNNIVNYFCILLNKIEFIGVDDMLKMAHLMLSQEHHIVVNDMSKYILCRVQELLKNTSYEVDLALLGGRSITSLKIMLQGAPYSNLMDIFRKKYNISTHSLINNVKKQYNVVADDEEPASDIGQLFE